MPPMPTPVDHDVVMGPPPLPPQITLSGSGDSRSRETQDIAEKYKKLKRKFNEMGEVCVSSATPPDVSSPLVNGATQKNKEAVYELRASGDRNARWRTERSYVPRSPLLLSPSS